MEKDNKKNNNLVRWVILGGIGVILIILIIILSQRKETYVSNDSQTTQLDSLECSSSKSEGIFFASDTAQRYTHEIKATFKEDNLKDISYKFNATYNSSEAVENAKAVLMAKYNLYMDENGLALGILNPVFSPLKSKLQITLFGNREKIDKVTGKLFFLTEDEASDLDKMSLTKLENIYKSKGFSCKSSK